MGIHNPREHQHVDGSGFGTQQRPRAGIDGRARGQDIVDQDDATALNLGLPAGFDLERALYVAGAPRSGQAASDGVRGARQSELVARRIDQVLH